MSPRIVSARLVALVALLAFTAIGVAAMSPEQKQQQPPFVPLPTLIGTAQAVSDLLERVLPGSSAHFAINLQVWSVGAYSSVIGIP